MTLTDTDLDLTFSALADPTRRAILARLRGGEATVGELAEPFDISLPAISRHLKVLERAGLISRRKEAQFRPCRLDAEPLRDVVEWAAAYRRHWDGNFARLDALLEDPATAADPEDRARPASTEPTSREDTP